MENCPGRPRSREPPSEDPATTWLEKNPALDTQKGTMKLTVTRTHVAAVASPPKITEPWLTSDSTVPTNNAIGTHRESDDLEKTVARNRGGAAPASAIT